MDNMASMPEFTSKTPNWLSRNLGIVYDELNGLDFLWVIPQFVIARSIRLG